MSSCGKLIVVAVMAGALGVTAVVARAWQVEGRVVGVHDGDSITVLDAERRQHKIRLDGIDAPELGQAFGRASKRHLSDLAFRRQVTANCQKTDRYGREVCCVVVGGDDVGLAQLERGMAWVFTRYERELPADRRAGYRSAEQAAQKGASGLWSDQAPVAPWEWRKSKGGAKGN